MLTKSRSIPPALARSTMCEYCENEAPFRGIVFAGTFSRNRNTGPPPSNKATDAWNPGLYVGYNNVIAISVSNKCRHGRSCKKRDRRSADKAIEQLDPAPNVLPCPLQVLLGLQIDLQDMQKTSSNEYRNEAVIELHNRYEQPVESCHRRRKHRRSTKSISADSRRIEARSSSISTILSSDSAEFDHISPKQTDVCARTNKAQQLKVHTDKDETTTDAAEQIFENCPAGHAIQACGCYAPGGEGSKLDKRRI